MLSVLLFGIGLFGFLKHRNLISLMVCLELMLNAVNLSFVSFSTFSNHIEGQVIVFFIITVAAAEVGVGLALAVLLFKKDKSFSIDKWNVLKG